MKIKIRLLNHKFFGGRRWYQYFNFGQGYQNLKYVGERGKYRTESFVKFLHSMEWSPDEVVVDVGCNAGRYCYEISQYVGKVVGVEYSKEFYTHAMYLRGLYIKNGFNLENVKIVNSDILKNLEVFDGANTVFLSKVLYHKNLQGMGEEILNYISNSTVNRILIQGHTTQGLMGEGEYVIDLLDKFGYQAYQYDHHVEYPITIAYRK